ncbi:unnamed protein product [Paramecium pentaurelia]|uniref:Uncharacterized protein n=1 Tax=Paramecium pentaurelia TaxID=43138 RepID=A0A8S1YGS6_9CILI|nr:unnamed protein product [Paramecium pentaurelia]
MNQFLKEHLNCISKQKMKQNQRILLVEYSNSAIFDNYYYMYKVKLIDSSQFLGFFQTLQMQNTYHQKECSQILID